MINQSSLSHQSSEILSSPAHIEAGMKVAFNLMALWGLNNEDMRVLLGHPKARTFFNWKKQDIKTVPTDTMRRIGYLLGIHKALRILFNNPENIYGWITRENIDFGGQSPLQRMLGGDPTDLAVIRQYLDAMRGGWS